MSLSQPERSGSKAGHPGCLMLFGLPFFLAGAFVFYMTVLAPWLSSQAAASWVATPCRIIHSEVTESRDSDGDRTYGVDIRFRYRFAEKAYESDRYWFIMGKSSGREEKAAAVKRHPVGSETTCFVDPKHPGEAVIDREHLGWELWLGIVLGGVFMLVGGGLMVGGGIAWRRRSRPRIDAGFASDLRASEQPAAALPDREAEEPKILTSGGGRWGKLLGILFFAVFWNGITWTILLLAIWPDVQKGDGFAWIPLLFISLFVLIGAAVALAVPYYLMALLNPRVQVRVMPGSPVIGRPTRIAWSLTGRTDRVDLLTIQLVLREKATYTRGTNTTTDTKEVFRLDIARCEPGPELVEGDRDVTVPLTVPPSFKADRNELEWQIEVKGSIAWWPDIADAWTVTVRPATLERPATPERPAMPERSGP